MRIRLPAHARQNPSRAPSARPRSVACSASAIVRRKSSALHDVGDPIRCCVEPCASVCFACSLRARAPWCWLGPCRCVSRRAILLASRAMAACPRWTSTSRRSPTGFRRSCSNATVCARSSRAKPLRRHRSPHVSRAVVIYLPAKSASQHGSGGRKWMVRFGTPSQWQNPLMVRSRHGDRPSAHCAGARERPALPRLRSRPLPPEA